MISLCKREAARLGAGAACTALVLLMAGAAQAAFVTIDAPSSTGPGSTIEFTVTLTSDGDEVASLATDIGYPPASGVDSVDGSPACALNPAVDKPQSGFRFRPSQCTPGTDCDEIRAGITSLDAATAKEPIPDGAVYTCSLTVAADAAGSTIDLTVVSATATFPDNSEEDITGDSQGASVTVVEPSAFVTIGTVDGLPGATVEFPVSLTNIEGSEVASLAVDFGFPAESPVDNTDGSPACVLNPTVNKPQSGFRFRPSQCTPGTDCNEIRAGITSLDAATAKEPIPDGVVFSCFLTIPASMTPGSTIPLTISSVTATDPDNNDTDITGNSQGGAVNVTDTPADTPTPTLVPVTDTPTMAPATDTPTPEAATATPTPTGLPSDAMLIKVGSVVGVEDTVQPVSITLFAGDALQVAGTQNDTGFSSAAQILANQSGRPDCAVNPAINKGGTSFAFQPPGCTPGDTCTGMRSFVLALDNVDAIPSGSVLYDCNVGIAAGANDAFPLTCSNAGGSDPVGGAIASECEDGCVDVPELVASTVAEGGSISTGDSTSEIDPTETTLTSPAGGLASILEEGRCPGTGEAPGGFTFVGLKVTTRAPLGSPANPVRLDFTMDESVFQGDEEGFVILKDGVPFVEECITDGTADPDPCVENVNRNKLRATVITTDANAVWEFAVLLPTPTPTVTFTETVTPEPTETPTVPGVDTPTNTPTNTRTGGTFDEDDGCQVVAPGDSGMVWLLLMPAALLVWRRRNSR